MIWLLIIPVLLSESSLKAQQIDPSDIFFQAWLIIREAEKQEKNADNARAYQTYSRAKKLFDDIALTHPRWKADIVKRRIQSTDAALQRLLKDAMIAENNNLKANRGLVGETIPQAPQTSNRQTSQLPPAPAPPNSSRPNINKNRVAQLEGQVSKLKGQVQDLSKTYKSKDTELRQAQQTLANSQEALRNLKSQTAAQKAAKLKSEVEMTRLKKQANDFQQQITTLLAERTNYTTQSDKQTAFEKQIATLEKQLTASHTRIKQLETSHTTALNTAPIYPIDSEKQKKVATLEKEVADYEKKVSQLAETNKEQGLALQIANESLKKQNEKLLKIQALAEKPPQLAEKQEQLKQLQKQIAEIEKKLATTRNDRDQQAARNRRLLAQLKEEKEKLSKAPVQAELDELNRKLQRVTAEKEAISLSLRQSHQKLETAVTAANLIKSQQDKASTEKDQIQKHLNQERQSSNDVIRGLRAQLKSKQDLLDKQAKLLAKAYQKSDDLNRQLTEANEVVAELQKEKQVLLTERDQMANLLNLSKTDRVQLMVDENMQMGKQLREAREAIQKLVNDNDATNDQLLIARQDLAVAKQRIITLREERVAQDNRLTDLKTKLQTVNEQLLAADLAASSDSPESDEVRMLQNVIKRQLLAQERRSQQTTLMLAQLQRLSTEDPAFADALVSLADEEFELTDEEQKLLTNKKIDQKFVAANRATPEERRRAAAALQAKRSVMVGSAERCYSSNRFRAARELYEMVLDVSPGHIPSLINLGTVNLKLQDYSAAEQSFKNAITLRVNQPLPYAHYMLGVIDYEQGLLDEAREKFDHALSLYDENAHAHVYLGNIAGLQDPHTARNHFERALEIDPTLSDPHYNLAFLSYKERNKEGAQKHYQQLLLKGGQPDPELEANINKLK